MSGRVTQFHRRLAAAVGYMPPGFPIAGLVLMLVSRNTYVRFHALQSLLLAVVGFVGFVLLNYLRALGWALLPFWILVIFVWWLVGWVNGLKGKRYLLPIVGKYANRFVPE